MRFNQLIVIIYLSWMNLFCGCKNEGGTESSSIGNKNGGGGKQEKEGEDGEGDEQVDRGHGGAEIQRGRQQQAGRIVRNNLGQDLVENIIPANVDARGGPPAELGMNKAARGHPAGGFGGVVELPRVDVPLHRRGGVGPAPGGGRRVELEGRDGVEVGRSEDSTTDDDSTVSSLSSLESEEILPEEINLQQRPSNIIDVVFESFMTSGNDENYIVREFASENFVRPDGEVMENFIEFGQLDEPAKSLTFTSYEDHINARGCIRFGPPEEEGIVFNMFCCDLQVLAISKPVSLSVISNTSPQEYFQSSASRVSSRVPQRTIPIESLGAAIALYPEPIPSLLNSLNAIVYDGSDMEKLVAQIVLEILKWLNNNQEYEYHVFGVNHGPFTVGKVRRIEAAALDGADGVVDYNLPWSNTTAAPLGGPRTIGRSVFLRSIPNHVMHPYDVRLRRKLEVGKNITLILLSKFQERFSSEIVENVLVNIEYDRMWYTSTYRNVQAEFALNTAAATSSGDGTVADDTMKFIKYNDNPSFASYKYGKIHGCFKSGSTRLCMQLIICSSGVSSFSDLPSNHAEYYHGTFRINVESRGEASSENVNVAGLDGCNAAPFRSKDVPLCVKSVLDAVHGMMEEGQTMLSVSVQYMKFGRVIESASVAGAATRGQQFVETDSVYLYDQYYYVNVNTNHKLTESFNSESRDWIAAHSGILNSFVRVAPASSVLEAHIATDWTSSVQLLPLSAEGEVSAPISIFATSQPVFSTSIGDKRGKAMGCWITPTDPRSAHVIQFCVSLMMFYTTSAEMMERNLGGMILNGYDTLEHALESTSGSSAPPPVEQSLVLNRPFLHRLSECGRDIRKCVGVVASQLFALASERHSLIKQAVVGLYAEKMKASIIAVTALTPDDARRVSRYPQNAFSAKDYHGENSENVDGHILVPPMYSAFHPNEANLAVAISQAFLATAIQTMSTNMLEAVQAMLVAQNFLSNVARSDSRGWIERTGGSTSHFVTATFEEKLVSPVNRITFRYNRQTLFGSINGCFDALGSGLRFCLVSQIFMKPHVSSASSDQAYTQSETPELAMDNLPANDGQTPVEDDVVHNYPSDLVRLSRSLEGTTHYIGDFIMNQLVYDWKSLVGGVC